MIDDGGVMSVDVRTSLRFVVLASVLAGPVQALDVGFGEVDITPKLGGEEKVWLAGYGTGRQAAGVHDPLMARCVVLEEGRTRIALVSVDLVGLQFPAVQEIRRQLPEFTYVLVSSTHNHEGPDVVGMWGRNQFSYGVNDDYVAEVVRRCRELVKSTARATVKDVRVSYGTAEDRNLLKDSRQPIVFDAVLRVLVFSRKNGEKAGLLVQWNSHPEAMGSKNKLITADFPWATVRELKKNYECPVAYFTGTVGGLMAPPAGPTTFEYTEKHGIEVAGLAAQAIEAAEPLELTPMKVQAQLIYIPITNRLYRLGLSMRVLRRAGFVSTGDPYRKGQAMSAKISDQLMTIETEVARLQLGELSLAAIPGELYPELVYGEFQEPADPAADFPEAALEPTIAETLGEGKWMLFGLANDEVGYLIPKRQWDARKPFAYGRKKSQYGEANSCGPEAAAVVMKGFARCVAGQQGSLQAGEASKKGPGGEADPEAGKSKAGGGKQD